MKAKMNRLLASVLASVLVISTMTPGMAYAQEADTENEVAANSIEIVEVVEIVENADMDEYVSDEETDYEQPDEMSYEDDSNIESEPDAGSEPEYDEPAQFTPVEESEPENVPESESWSTTEGEPENIPESESVSADENVPMDSSSEDTSDGSNDVLMDSSAMDVSDTSYEPESSKDSEPDSGITDEAADPTVENESAESNSDTHTCDRNEELNIPVHKFTDQVADVQIKTIRLTDSKSKRIVVETLKNGWRIITTQYLVDGEIVSESVLNQAEDRENIQKENEEYTRELEEQIRSKREEAELLRQQEEDEKERLRLLAEDDDPNSADLTLQQLRDKKAASEMISDTLNSLSYDELLEVYSEISNGNDAEFIKQLVSDVNDATSSDYNMTEDMAKKVVTGMFKNLIFGAVKQIPGSDYFATCVTGLINGALGLDDNKDNLKQTIESGNERLSNELMEGFAKTERNIDNYGTLKEYGSRLDEFTDYTKMRIDGIRDYSTNKYYTDLEKTVRIANLIGSSDEWHTGANNGNIMKSLISASEVFKGKKNIDDRDIFNIIYDINKENSLFAGEAMSKSQGKIEMAVNGFINNCRIISECLNAHEAISNFTEEEVASLDPQTREIYNRIHTNHDTITEMRSKLAAIFLGDRSASTEEERFGLLDKAGQYYSKIKTTYINYGSNGEGIALKDTLKVNRGSDFIKEDRYTDLDKIDHTVKESGLTGSDITKIAYHARSHGMSITEYLEACGFDVENVRYGYHYLISNPYYYDEETALGLWKLGPDHEGAEVYEMENKSLMPRKEKVSLSTIDVCMEYGYKIKEEVIANKNNNVALITFEKQ